VYGLCRDIFCASNKPAAAQACLLCCCLVWKFCVSNFQLNFFCCRFCGECRTKVLRAYTLLVEEPDPCREKGYVPALYLGIKRCIPEKHIHLQAQTAYIANLITRAEPELMGRWGKTLLEAVYNRLAFTCCNNNVIGATKIQIFVAKDKRSLLYGKLLVKMGALSLLSGDRSGADVCIWLRTPLRLEG
jgi:hypothetical protein